MSPVIKSGLSPTHQLPPVSIVLAVHNQAVELKRNLPILLSLQYAPGYEVVVVDESSTDETEEVLKLLKNQFAHLYTTYIPANSHYVSRDKLALTVGIKAAHHEWIVITEANCYPENELWLNTMAEYMTEGVDVVCGYTAYCKGTKGRYSFLRMMNFWRQRHRAYRYDGANLAIRKSAFMKRDGFLKNLKYLRGEYDFLVNETERGRIAVARQPDARMRQMEPTQKEWRNTHLFYMQIRSHLHHAFLSRLLFVVTQAGIHLSYLIAIVALAYFIYLRHSVYIAITVAFLLLFIAFRTFFGYRLSKNYGESIALWKLPFLDLGVAWHYVLFWLRYVLSNKHDFIRK